MSLLVLCVLAGTLVVSPALFPLPAFAEGGNGGSTSSISDGGAGGADSATATGDAGGEGTFAVTAGGGGGAGAAGGAGGKSGGASGAGGAGAIAAGGTGSDGGQGETISGSGSGGGGGGGGAHGQVLTTTTTDAGAIGGSGGRGGNGSPIDGPGGGGGGGGAAGWGVVVDSTGLTYTLTGTAEGGTGGAGGNGSGAQGTGGGGGTGGTGVFFTGSGTLVNSGTILGGAGGAGGTSANLAGVAGAGGTGVVGADLTIINAGAISGGLSGDGVTRANAISFTGGSNSLTLQEGWSLTGNLAVNAPGSSLTFKLDGIDADVSNDVNGQGGVVVDVGPQILTLSGVNSYSGGTTITSGTLSVASKAALGDGVDISFNASASGVTGLSAAASALSSAISTYASAPTAENAAALAAAQASYRQAIGAGQASGELPTLQITGAVSLDPATDGPITVGFGRAAAIRLEGADAGLSLHGFQSSLAGAAIVVDGDMLDLGVGEGQTQGYVFSDNHADLGGVLYHTIGTVSIAGATFSDNSAVYSGGAIYNYSALALADSLFTGNSSGSGGALAQNGTLLVERSSFTGNDAQSSGGAIVAWGGSTAVIASSFSGNSAGDRGGAISVEGASSPVVASLVDSDFTGNSAGSSGGAIAMIGGTLNLTVSDGSSSLFSGNMAGGQASAIDVDTGVRTYDGQQYYYTASALNVDTGTGALLDMRDPMSGNADTLTNTVAKTGAGTWALGGANVFTVSSTGSTDVSVSEGQLYLYAAGEVDNPTTQDEDAKVGAGTLQFDGAGSTFTVGADGTLVAGGANSVTTAGSMSFEDGATLRGGNATTTMGGTDATFMEAGGATSLNLAATGGITLEGTLNVAALGATDSFTLSGVLGGADGALVKSGAGMVTLTSASTFAGGTTISAGTLALSGSGALAAAGAVTLDGATGVFDISAADGARIIGDLSGVAGSSVVLGDNDLTVGGSGDTTFAGSFDGTGGLTKAGAGALTLSGPSAQSWQVDAGTLAAAAGSFTGNVGIDGDATFQLVAATASTYAGTLAGTGTFATSGAGVLAYTGNSAAFAGTTRVTAGELAVNGTLGGAVEVSAGAALGGSGTVSGEVTVASGGSLMPGNSPGTLTVGALVLNNASSLEFELGQPGVAGGPNNDLVAVTGGLTLDGVATLDLTPPGLGTYTYTLFTYGSLTADNGLILTGAVGYDFALAVDDGQVDLIVSQNGLQYWNGSQDPPNGTVRGGDGVWNNGSANWTDASGLSANPWGGLTAVFVGAAGTVDVTEEVAVAGLQFGTTGYRLEGEGALRLSGADSEVRVGADVSAEIATQIIGSGGLLKTGAGTLELSGVNSYEGGTTLAMGVLQISDDRNLGDADGGLTFLGGTLATTASLTSNRQVTLSGTGTFDVADGTIATLAGVVEGPGGLMKQGDGTLALAGASTYAGVTDIVAGTLRAETSSGLSSLSAHRVNQGARLEIADGVGAEIAALEDGALGGGVVLLDGPDSALSVGGDDRDTRFSGSFAGDGLLEKTGSGTLTLTGTDSQLGALSLCACGAGGGITIDGGSLAVSGTTGHPSTVSMDDSRLAVIGGGSLTVTGSNALFEVGGGVVEVSGSGSHITVEGAAQIGVEQSRGFLVSDGGRFEVDQTAIFTDLGAPTSLLVTGTGSVLEVHGLMEIGFLPLDHTGTLTVADGGTVRVRDTLHVNAGSRLVIGTGGAAGAVDAGIIENDGAIIGNFTDLATLAAPIAGSGKVVMNGAGTLVLSGANSYRGGTELAGGVVQVAADANLGDAASGLTFDGGTLSTTASFASARAVNVAASGGFDVAEGTTLALSGTLAGSGDLAKLGGGGLNYTGNGSAFTGVTTVQAGLLQVNGSLGGPVSVLAGGTLGGSGTIGGLTVGSGGTVAPGTSPGTITVNGNVSFAAGSTYAAEMWADGTHDLIAATGTATLSGGTVSLLAQAGYENPLATYTILSAQAGVAGQFASVVSNYAFISPSLSYDSGNVYLTLARNDVDFATTALTSNQSAVANAAQSLGLGDAVFNSVLQLTAGQAPAAFDQLSGEVHASLQSVFMEQSSLIRGALNDRLRAAQGGVAAAAGTVVSVVGTPDGALAYAAPATEGTPGTPAFAALKAPMPAPAEKFALWTTGFGNWGSFDGTANAAGINDSTGGFLIGADTLVFDGWRIGVAGGYSYTDFSIAGRNSSGNSDNWHAALYAGRNWDALALRSGLAYTWQDVSTNRTVGFPGFTDSLSADYNAGTFQAFGELGYRIDAPFASFEPFANLAYVRLNTDGYAEQGGAAALYSDGADFDTTFATLGLRASSELTLGAYEATLRGTIGWRHAFGDIAPSVTQAFVGSDAFTITGVPIAEDAAVLEAGLDLRLSASWTLGIAYTGQFGDGVTQNGFNAALTVKF
ncbi:autotransporter domain-containing protein [Ancylobacter amanitiformis]|uniref:Outer membrane autotransporter protein n=1 Tax=Ancylobacter amanitiformis TaxID=217069 RepID=A0ABU0LXJ7_9HYPH|nr:autotransporter domain-containing protein [Ancylobacter amanitiformis]MDQ0513404.1 outer membrane autotransporter protein [Ancylobacter amanitiformis]